MSWSWHAKVHKSGSKVAVFNGSKLVKVVEASKETFEPAEAQKFAEDLVNELAGKTSSQMSAPSEQPAVTTEGELQSAVLNAVTTQAQGAGAGAAPVAAPVVPEELDEGSEENTEGSEAEVPEGDDEEKYANLMNTVASLKKKLASERNDRVVERKARRGLAIAKQLVAEGKLEDSYEAIKSKIASIVKLEDSEIDRLERKVAGEHEFISIDDAQKELRRQSRIVRINRQAAAEAQEDDDIEQAEMLDGKADEAEAKVAHIQSVIETMTKSAEEETEEKPEVVETPETTETPAVEKDEKEAASQVPPVTETPVVVEEKKEEEKADATEPVETETPATPVEASNKLAELARNYRLIASHHRKLAEEAESKGDIGAADKHDSLGDAAEENAEEVEKKLAECSAAPVVEEEKADAETPAEEAAETPEEESTEAPAKESSREPGKTVTSSKHQPLKRDNEAVEDSSFGIDKNASLVEQNDFSGDPEVEVLSKMWRGAPQDE
jgi:hypothetical protein